MAGDGSRWESEEGAVAILYSVAMLMMIALLALTLDAGAMRYDRRHTQSVSDMAVLAGATDLHELVGGSPQKACETAWGYVLENIGEPEQVDACLDATGAPRFADLMDDCRADPTMTPVVGIGRTENYQAEIYWPVPEGDLLDGRYDPQVDGTSPCDRIAVKVFRSRGFVFGGAVGSSGATVGAPAVALANAEEQGNQAVTLVVLDETGRGSLCAAGGGQTGAGVWVHESPDGGGGFIAVDSDGTTAGTCDNTTATHTIWAQGGGAQIKAGVVYGDPTGTVAPDGGEIFSYALLLDPANSNSWKENGNGATIEPEPIGGERVTRQPVDDRYGGAIAHLTTYLGDPPGTPPDGTSGVWGSSWTRYTTWMAANRPDVTNPCLLQSGVEVTLGPGHWWIDCPNLVIEAASKLLIPGSGNVVFDGTVEVKKGELAINHTIGNLDNLVFFRSGASLLRSGNETALRLGRTFPSWLEGPAGNVTCSDGADNDSDGLTDDADPDCQNHPEGPLGHRTCTNGTDDDNDGLVDGDGDATTEPGEDPDCETAYPGTTVVLQDGVMHVAGGSSAVLEWAAPWQRDPDRSTLDARDLHALALWSERATSPAECAVGTPPTSCYYLSGGANLGLYGLYFVPNSSPFTFAGQGLMSQQRAQFVTRRLVARGQGFLRMEPDPDFVEFQVELNVRLIR